MKFKFDLKFKIENLKLRWSWPTLIYLTVFTGIVIGLFTWLSKPTHAAWYDENYLYRHKVTFTHNAAVSADRAVTFTLDTAELITAGNMQSDCDDTRFTDLNGKALLHDLTGTCNNATTTYEVIFPSILNGTNTFYVYYGNASAANAEINSTGYTALTPSGGDPSLTNPTTSGNQEKGPGPVSYWKFDEGYGTATSDSMAMNADGTLTNTPTWQPEDRCASGKCLDFDQASSEYITTADKDQYSPVVNDITVSIWAKVPTAASSSGNSACGSTGRYLMAKGGGVSDWEWGLENDSNSLLCFTLWQSGGSNHATVSSSRTLNDNKWHHYVITVDYLNQVVLYIDGQSITSTTSFTSTMSNGAQAVEIGRRGDGNYFDGLLDEAKIYNYARTAAQIKTDYVAGKAGKTTNSGTSASLGGNRDQVNQWMSNNLVGYWKMDESSTGASQTNRSDSSGNSNTLTDNNTTPSAIGKFANSADFNGSTEYFSITDNALLSTGDIDFTLCSWVYFDSTSGERGIAGKSDSSEKEYILLYNVGSNSRFSFSISSDSDTFDTTAVANSFGAASTSTWYFVCGWHDSAGNTINIQINGGAVDSTATGSTVPIDAAGGFNVGAYVDGSPASYLDGRVDELRFYKRVLTADERTRLYEWGPGPVGYWNLDENTGTSANDLSGNDNTATLTNTPNWAPGKYGSGVVFAGSNQHITRADDSDFDFDDDANLTLETWFKHNTASAQEIILSKFNEAGYKIVMESDGDITCGLDYDSTWSPTDSATSTAATYDDNNWHHIACVKNGAASLSLYIDGVLITTDSSLTATNTLTNSDPIYFGIDADGTSNDFTGSLDNIKIYNYARTQKQIVEDMNAGHPAGGSPVSSMVGYWSFDEQQGQTVYDKGNGDNDGTRGANSSSSTDDPTWKIAGTSSCKINGCLDFDGGDLVNITASSDANSGLGSVSLWFKTSTNFTEAGVLFYGSSVATGDGFGSENELHVNIRSDETLQLFIEGGASDVSILTTETYNDGNWHYVAATWDIDGQARLYVDGRLKGSATHDATNFNFSSILRVGHHSGSATARFFTGTIDEVKLYNSALTADEIKIDYNAGSAIALGGVLGTQDNEGFGGNAPVGWWKLDENTGTSTTADSSGNGYTATLNNFTASSWVPGKVGSGLTFDGSTTYAHCTDANCGGTSALDPGSGQALSISTWVKTTNTSRQVFVNKGIASGQFAYSLESGLLSGNDYPKFFLYNTSNTGYMQATAAKTIATGNWHHIVGTYDGTTIKIYVNGVLEGSSTSTTGTQVSDSTSNFEIGARNTNTLMFNGTMDDVRVYKYALSQAQVAHIYNRGAPHAWYKLDECQGLTAYNTAPTASGSGTINNSAISIGGTGTYTSAGTCSSGTSTEAWNGGTTGKRNYSLGLDGTDDYVDLGSLSMTGFTESTISLWVRPSDLSQSEDIIFSSKWDASDDIRFNVTSAVNVCATFDDGVADSACATSVGWSNNEWHHVLATQSNNDDTVKIYIDGILRTTTTSSDFTYSGLDNVTYVGRRTISTAEYFHGQIDDVRIYNYALTADQVKRVYNDGAVFFGPSTGSP